MKTLFGIGAAFVSILAAIACGKKEETKTPEAAAFSCDTTTYASSVGAILNANCTSCHSTAGGATPLTNATEAIAEASSISSEVEAGKMPANTAMATFKNTADGKTLVAWGKCASPK